eukprot:CAMPEP_0113669994 /NCGR_PEP_ID=MMETSP0038_2-20120614/4887_1 /TAXON_ID=2898 /ORGANISM="Cryptomonas paramecium" /LENGTH=160 /DNA_ID=CAMNT_0000585955 /DNA_START=129 /DNA_END=607 /DNA_ORIENTATION=- /assembly_acc=CAM_ASM_000170
MDTTTSSKDDSALNASVSSEAKAQMSPAPSAQAQSSESVIGVQSVLVDNTLPVLEASRVDAYPNQGLVVHGLRGLTVHTISYTAEGSPGISTGNISQQQIKERLKEKQKKYRHRQGQLVRELGELLPSGSGIRSLNQILAAAVTQVRANLWGSESVAGAA